MKYKYSVFLSCILLVACAADVDNGSVSSTTSSLSSLPNSDFEIDDDANLTVDNGSNFSDWTTVAEVRTTDTPSGTSDNSFGGGSKENDVCPSVVTGSIPNNKSDLLAFGIYREPGNPGFLHLFWTRVQEPTGTTLIDFELNQSTTGCGNGVNVERTPGDILIEYRIEQGGARAQIKFREWDGAAWGEETDLTALGVATGTINNTAISEADSDGLGALSPRTFGEATIDLSFIFRDNQCRSFGSAFVKSRSSDSFNSQLKDFIAPVPISLSNCGEVRIRKVTLPSGRTETFTFTHNLRTDPASSSTTFTLSDGEDQSFANVLLGTGYSVTETTDPNFELVSINCGASSGVEPTVDLGAGTVSFDVGDVSNVVDCTFTNRLRRGALVIQKYRTHAASGAGEHPHAGVTFTVEGGGVTRQVTTNSSGRICVPNLTFGSYTVTENVPEGYRGLTAPQTASVTEYGDCSTAQVVTFHNQPLTNLVCSVDSQVAGGTLSRIECVGEGQTVTSTLADDTSASLEDLLPGTYTCTVTVNP